MAKARISRVGNSQAVHLPKDFHIDADEVEIFRRGDEIVLRKKPPESLVRAFELLASLPADCFPDERDDPPPQKRR